MVFGMDTDSVSPEENNLLRLIYVIKKPCTECLRHVLKINIPSCYADIKNAVSSERIKLQGIFTKTQNSRIFPQNQLCPNFDISICDMTLLYTLIRNVSSVNPPTTGWDKPVNNQPRDPSIGANVERLRVLRNSIIHEERHDITDSEFNNFWSDIEASLADIDQSLGNTRFQQDLIYLRTLNLDTKFVKKEITKIRTRKYFQELKEGQKEQMVVIDEVNNKTTKIEDRVCRNAEQIGELKDILTKIQHQVSGSAVQCEERREKVTDPQEVTGCEGIQGLSLEELENSDRSNQQCINDGKIEEASYTNCMNIRNQHHNETANKGAPNDAMNCDLIRENDISIAEGPDGFICLTKKFVYIKSNLLKKDADEIAECLLKEELFTAEEHETIVNLRRKPCVDTLLKKIILGNAEQMKTFFRALKYVNQKVFRELDATKVTDEERSRFNQVKGCRLQLTNAKVISNSESTLDDSDILFFQNCLSASREVVDSINDAMLSRFNFSVRDHSNVLECRNSDPKIRKLCETINHCSVNVENELKNLLRESLYEEWMEFRKRKENNDRQLYVRWLNALTSLVRFIFPFLRFNKAVNGCIILQFSTGDGFDIASLTRDFVQENLTDLLWKGYLETQINIKNPVHVTVFIMSPSRNGKDEIHFYLDFDATENRTRGEDYEQEIADKERFFLLEQLDLVELTEWMTNQPDMEETTKHMLEDKLSNSDMSRKEELIVLLDSIYDIKNGRELIKRFCKENDLEVYKSLFATIDQDSSEKQTCLVQKPLQYEMGGGLQKLYSFWMDINADQKDNTMSKETKDLQRATLDERSSNEFPNPEVSYSDISSGFGIEPKIQKTDDDPLEPTVWKEKGITFVIQVGKLDQVLSDVMVIFGNCQSSRDLPRTIIEKVGPQIQREFQEKYPNGLSKEEVAVLSGFNLPVWKIFYCECSRDQIMKCIKIANKLKMRSILFLVQDEWFARCFESEIRDLNDWPIFYTHMVSISTIYFHVDQDTIEWKNLRKMAEYELFTNKAFFSPFQDYRAEIKLSANPEPKVCNVGQLTVFTQVGKMEEIQSDIAVIFEMAKGQWPTENLPSEVLEKAGPMIQKEFKEKYPAGLEYAEVAVLNGYNLPFRKILYGVLPHWPVKWLKQVIEVFLTECFQLSSDEGIKSISFVIPSVTYDVAKMYASVLHSCVELLINKPSFSISTQNIVIKDGCTGANMLKQVFEEEWARRIVFKEGHVTVVIRERSFEEILLRRGKDTLRCTMLSEEPQESLILPDSKGLVIILYFEDIATILEEISPTLKAEFATKYKSYLANGEVASLDGHNSPFRKIYCSSCRPFEVTDAILECFQMAENDKMNSITLLSHYPEWAFTGLTREIILGLKIFVIENPSSSIRRLYLDSQTYIQEISDDTSVKVFRERAVTVVLNARYDDHDYIGHLIPAYDGRPAEKTKSVHVICDGTDISWPNGIFNRHLKFMLKEDKVHIQKRFTSGVSVLEHLTCNTMRVFCATPSGERQDMDKFFYECLQMADVNGVSSVTFLVPEYCKKIKLFASTLSSCVKRFAENTQSSSIKRYYIRISEWNSEETEQVIEEEWAKATTSGGKQGYPSEDLYLKKAMTYPKVAEKSKEGSKYVPDLGKTMIYSKVDEKSKEGSNYVPQEEVD